MKGGPPSGPPFARKPLKGRPASQDQKVAFALRGPVTIPSMLHLRMPSIDQGVQAGAWAVFFFLLLWLGMLALGVSDATALILSLVSAGAIFLFIRTRGEDRPGERVGP
jgi:hypothetical protein